MNKKYIILGLVITGVVVGAVYFYNKNKKTSNTNNSTTNTNNNQSDLATKEQANEIIKSFSDMGTPIQAEKINYFIDLYTKEIPKSLHPKILALVKKNFAEWTEQDKNDFKVFQEKIINKLK
jgi:hypothetical protein